ncbi:hypothetical protein EON79_17170, partial [bacterium]
VYDPRARSGAFDIEGTTLALAPLAEELAPGSTLDGTASIRIEGTLAGGRLAVATGETSLRDVRLNGELIGSGTATARLENDDVTGEVELGQIDRYVSISKIAIDLGDKTVAGQVEASNLSIKSLVAIGLPYAEDLSYDTERSLRAVDGGVNFGASVSGTFEDPNVAVETLEARNLTYDGKRLGDLIATGGYEAGGYRLASLTFTGPIGDIGAQGALTQAGALTAEVDHVRVDLARLGEVIPSLAGRTGVIEASANLGGTLEEPTLIGTLNASGVLANPALNSDQGLRVDLDTITADRKTGIHAEGDFFYRGFTGKLVADTAAPALFGEVIPRPTEATLTLANRPLTEVASLMDGLDEKRTTGTVGGVAVLKQAPGGAAQLSGRIEAKGELAIAGLEDTLKNLDASVALQGTNLVLVVNGQPSRGGTLASTTTLDLGDPIKLASEVAAQGAGPVLARPVDAKIDLSGIAIRQKFPNDPKALLSGGFINGNVDGTVTVKGAMTSPLVAGNLEVTGADTQIPAVQSQPGGSGQSFVDPSFNLRIRLNDPAHVRSATADLNLLGGGTIKGKLSALDVNSRLNVEKGSIRLPGGRVVLEQGGTIDVSYDGRNEDGAEAQVNLEGRTSVTAQSASGTIQRYDINLVVRGDLLKDGGLVLNATSDPGDLSQDRILALLGATDTLNVLNTGTDRG